MYDRRFTGKSTVRSSQFFCRRRSRGMLISGPSLTSTDARTYLSPDLQLKNNTIYVDCFITVIQQQWTSSIRRVLDAHSLWASITVLTESSRVLAIRAIKENAISNKKEVNRIRLEQRSHNDVKVYGWHRVYAVLPVLHHSVTYLLTTYWTEN
jgi:hypothetical protein